MCIYLCACLFAFYKQFFFFFKLHLFQRLQIEVLNVLLLWLVLASMVMFRPVYLKMSALNNTLPLQPVTLALNGPTVCLRWAEGLGREEVEGVPYLRGTGRL